MTSIKYISEKLNSFEKALTTLQKTIVERPTDIERDAAIQRFEYCFELSWKLLKIALEEQGNKPDIPSPKSVFKKAFLFNLITDEGIWSEILVERNQTTHTYNEELAKEVYSKIPSFYKAMYQLLEKLKTHYS